MQYRTAQMGYVAVVVAVLGIATGAVINLYAITAKPSRPWDADIDRLVAQYQEKKQQAALAPQSVQAEPATYETTGSLADSEERVSESTTQKNAQPASSNRATGRHGTHHFIPAAFATLPKFAAATRSMLLRFP